MCGIVGYIGGKEAVPILLDGLRRLEYRGYDSAGIAITGVKLQVVNVPVAYKSWSEPYGLQICRVRSGLDTPAGQLTAGRVPKTPIRI